MYWSKIINGEPWRLTLNTTFSASVAFSIYNFDCEYIVCACSLAVRNARYDTDIPGSILIREHFFLSTCFLCVKFSIINRFNAAVDADDIQKFVDSFVKMSKLLFFSTKFWFYEISRSKWVQTSWSKWVQTSWSKWVQTSLSKWVQWF